MNHKYGGNIISANCIKGHGGTGGNAFDMSTAFLASPLYLTNIQVHHNDVVVKGWVKDGPLGGGSRTNFA